VWLRRDGCRDGRPQYCFFVRWGFICLFSQYAAKLSYPIFSSLLGANGWGCCKCGRACYVFVPRRKRPSGRNRSEVPMSTHIGYTPCWQLVFIHIRLVVICLDFFIIIPNQHQLIHEAQIYFVFLSVGNPKTVLKGGCSGWRGGSSFASLWFEGWLVWACKCAYDCA